MPQTQYNGTAPESRVMRGRAACIDAATDADAPAMLRAGCPTVTK